MWVMKTWPYKIGNIFFYLHISNKRKVWVGEATGIVGSERDYSDLIMHRLTNFYCFTLPEFHEQRRDFSLSDAPFSSWLQILLRWLLCPRLLLCHYFYFHFVRNWDAFLLFIWCSAVCVIAFMIKRRLLKDFKGVNFKGVFIFLRSDTYLLLARVTFAILMKKFNSKRL